ncbi:uncharacterized protein EI97DRAFT_496154 [Westerdykella ornata]|uniref:Mediator of RNA polymerase II transcription subunit 18 n=1 Tax=Westerdykella ornata TaxID=318751 RepID=A0A6A6JAF9_WESOR|nr:uncharacterized protein EI97DRAFT_496154 [Westerdykella ornata]KAF2273224.1 hypothetical protein EI97DRAFT_496154 [Westerdykella ornata]
MSCYELLLEDQIWQARHEQVLKVLAGVAAHQPVPLLRRQIVYRPDREPEEALSHLKRGGSQAVDLKTVTKTAQQKQQQQARARDLYCTRLHQELDKDDLDPARRRHHHNGNHNNTLSADDGTRWSWVFEEVPIAGGRDGLTVRKASSTDFVAGDPHAYLIDNGYKFVTEYYVSGHRFMHGNIELTLYRILHEPDVRLSQTAPKIVLPSLDDLKLVDPSGAYLVEAKLRVEDINIEPLARQCCQEMNEFREMMKGCVNFEAPDRLELDYRLKPADTQRVAR